MVRDAIIALIQLSLLCWGPCYSAVLPKWVYRVDSCPNPNNFSQWIEASKRLNCFHNLTSTKSSKQAMVYHCLPSSFLNETVEFCGRNVPVSPGNCPIYNYEVVQNTQPTSHNCTDFISGCPTNMFYSKEVYKHPACLKLNTHMRCFAEESKCSYESTTHSSSPTQRVTSMVTQTTSTISFDIDDSSPNSIVTTYISIGCLSAICVVNLAVFIYWILWRRKNNKCKWNRREMTITNTELLRIKQNQKELYERHQRQEDTTNCNENDTERSSLLNAWKDAKTYQYNNFLQSLKKEITQGMVNDIKCRLKGRTENEPDALESIHDPYELLMYLDRKYNMSYNLTFLQGIFLSCKAPKLFDRCVEYAKSRGEEIVFSEKKILESDHTKVIYIINCPNIHRFKWEELEKLRSSFNALTGALYDDILVAGVKSGCVIVTFMIRNCLIPRLKTLYTSEKRSNASQWMLKLPLKYKIIKIMVQDDVIYMSDDTLSVDEITAEAKLSGEAQKSCVKSDGGETPMTGFFAADKVSEIKPGRCIPGMRIRNLSKKSFGTVGFLVKSNDHTTLPVSGFLTSARVVVEDCDNLYNENCLLTELIKNHRTIAQNSHIIIQQSLSFSDVGEQVGEVVESFIGNYTPIGSDTPFGMDAAFVKTFLPNNGALSPMPIADDSQLTFDGTTKVIKRNRITGDTEGVLMNNTLTAKIGGYIQNRPLYKFLNCYEIKSINKDKPFFQPGDSGSAVFVQGKNQTVLPLGIAFACQCDTTYVCRIDKITQAFNVSIYEEEE